MLENTEILRKALVLGAGHAQADLMRFLKKNRWWVISSGLHQESKCRNIADEFRRLDVRDIGAVERLARANSVDLIYSVGLDAAVPTIATVAGKLGLPTFVSPRTTEIACNKLLLRDFLSSVNLSPVQYRPVRELDSLQSWQKFPAVLKPSDNQGQRGIVLLESPATLSRAFDEAVRHSATRTLIVEEFLEGPEISVNVVVFESQIVFCVVSDRLTLKGPKIGLPVAHRAPSKRCKGEALMETQTLIQRCIEVLGIEYGPVYFQIILTDAGPKIIEITPRLDGCHLWRLIRFVTGADILDDCIRMLTGKKPVILSTAQDQGAYSLKYFLARPQEVFYQSKHRPPNGASFYEYYYCDGELINNINNVAEKIGYFIEKCQ